jgi:beta-barrel assembly-enhancing protease
MDHSATGHAEPLRACHGAGVVTACAAAVLLAVASTAGAQVAPIKREVGKAIDKSIQELTFTEEEERQIGADVSAKLRERYGVVQNAAVHRYVTLAGTALARQSTRPDLKWTFIVLDTDGVNAFAAPGGFIHITRGTLALVRNEAELAGVLGHEIAHVTTKHTLNSIRQAKIAGAPGAVTRIQVLDNVVTNVHRLTLENAFSSTEEKQADEIGITLANAMGYSPGALGGFLTRLSARNRDLADRSGLFASHPDIQARLKNLEKEIDRKRLAGTSLVEARYAKSITYKPVAVAQLAQVSPPPAPPPAPAAPEKGGKGIFGLGGLTSLGREKASTTTTSATGSRGLNPDRDAKGGPNKALVVVVVSAADVVTFRAGISR